MNKFEDITVVHLDDSDFDESGILHEKAQREVDIAHVVIRKDCVIKDRLNILSKLEL